MHVKFIQTQANFTANYVVLSDDNTLCYSAKIPRKSLLTKITFFKNEELLYHIGFDLSENIKNLARYGVKSKGLPFIIYNNYDEIIGTVFLKRTKNFCGYSYYELQFNNSLYCVYAIGMGKEGVKIAFYENDRQVALIEKGILVYDNKDEYDIYALNPLYIEIASLFCLYYDGIAYANRRESVYKKKQYNYLYTLDKELKSKYNPAFKEQC